MLRLVATRAAFRSHFLRIDANLRPRFLTLVIIPPARDIINLPHLSRKRNKVGCVPDKLQRCGAVEVVRNHIEAAVVVDSYESAGIGERRITPSATGPDAIRNCVEFAMPSKFHVEEERGAGRHRRELARVRVKVDNLAVPGQMGIGTRLGHVNVVSRNRKPRRRNVLQERDQLCDVARIAWIDAGAVIECDRQYAVVIRVRN